MKKTVTAADIFTLSERYPNLKIRDFAGIAHILGVELDVNLYGSGPNAEPIQMHETRFGVLPDKKWSWLVQNLQRNLASAGWLASLQTIASWSPAEQSQVSLWLLYYSQPSESIPWRVAFDCVRHGER